MRVEREGECTMENGEMERLKKKKEKEEKRMECAKILNFIDGMDGMGVSSRSPNKHGYQYSIMGAVESDLFPHPKHHGKSHIADQHQPQLPRTFRIQCDLLLFCSECASVRLFFLIICVTLPGISQSS